MYADLVRESLESNGLLDRATLNRVLLPTDRVPDWSTIISVMCDPEDHMVYRDAAKRYINSLTDRDISYIAAE